MMVMTEAEGFVLNQKWRMGRTVGRTVYAQLSDDPKDSDPLIGVMDTAVFAAHIVKLHNDGLAGMRELAGVLGE